MRIGGKRKEKFRVVAINYVNHIILWDIQKRKIVNDDPLIMSQKFIQNGINIFWIMFMDHPL